MTLSKRDIIQSELSKKIIEADMFGIADIAPRVGKIKITLNCLKPKDSVIIAYPESNIKKSWVNDIKLWKFKGKKIKYSTYMSFSKLKEGCDVLVLDEAHLISEAQMIDIYKYIKKFGIKKVLALSGTLSQDTKDKLLKVLNLSVIANYSIESAVADGIVSDYNIQVRFTNLSSIKNIPVKWTGGNFMTSEKASFDYLSNKILVEQNPRKKKMWRLMRMGAIKKSQSKIDLTRGILSELKDKRVLVFCGLIDVAENLGIDSYHSKSKDETVADRFINGDLDKLAVVRQLNAGVTFKSINTAVINFFDSNEENMAQKISRITCLEYDNPEKVANIIIICSTESQERLWLEKSLTFFDKSKIKYLNY